MVLGKFRDIAGGVRGIVFGNEYLKMIVIGTIFIVRFEFYVSAFC